MPDYNVTNDYFKVWNLTHSTRFSSLYNWFQVYVGADGTGGAMPEHGVAWKQGVFIAELILHHKFQASNKILIQ